jgi:hypothetical protein
MQLDADAKSDSVTAQRAVLSLGSCGPLPPAWEQEFG